MNCLLCGHRSRLLHRRLSDDRFKAPGLYNIYHCSRCDFAQTYPRLNRRQISKFYSRYYPLSKATASQVRRDAHPTNRFLAWLTGTNHQAHLEVAPRSTVLDVGSGSGASVLYLKNRSCQAFGVEPDAHAQKLACSLKLTIHSGLLTDMPFPKQKFFHITASQVIEHEPHPASFLAAAHKKLNEEGKLILSFPNFNSLNRRLFGRAWVNWHVPYHLNFFSLKAINQLATKTGFQVLRHRTATPVVWVRLQLQLRFNPKNHPGATSSLILALSFLTIPAYRLLDIFGLGDSLVVTFSKLPAK